MAGAAGAVSSAGNNLMTNAALDLQVEERDGIQVIHVAGPLDSATHDAFKNFLDPLVVHPRSRIVLDCGNLAYVNSRGLTLLARYQRVAAANLSFFGIAAVNVRICKAIDLLGLGKMMKLYPSVDEALRAAAAP